MVSEISGRGYDVASVWQDFFKTVDKNGDGSIDESEMTSAAPQNGIAVEDIFTKMDEDQDGAITQSEFESVLSKLRLKRPAGPPSQAGMWERSDNAFGKIDANGDGSISQEEWSAAMAPSGEASSDAAANSGGEERMIQISFDRLQRAIDEPSGSTSGPV